MLKFVRIALVILFVLALAGAAGVFFYNYTHEDTSAPAFRSDADLIEISVTDPSDALLQGLRAYDNVDGDLTSKIRVKEISKLINDTDVVATYIVLDEASNSATCSRTVRYTDYQSPHFALTRAMIFNVGESISFREAVVVTDQREGNISGRLKLEESTVINNTPGTYTARLSATNRMGDKVDLPLTIQVIDNSVTRPKITLSKYLIYADRGSNPHYRTYLKEIIDPMAEDQETPIQPYTVSINYAGVDTDTPGVYEAYYYYTGISGEIATVILTVIVE